jgi:putative ABC transport system permease protein
MIIYDLKNALRFIKQHRGFSIINILGLTIGNFCCLLIILYVQSELTFDRFHRNGDNIYRVVMRQPGNRVVGSSSDWWVVSPAILKPTWENELPEVNLVAKTQYRFLTFRHSDQLINEEILFVDPEFLSIFTFPLLKGNKDQALNGINTIVISEKMSRKYFGVENPIGKELEVNDGRQLIVSGVLKEVPKNSHLQFDFLVSFKTLESIQGRSLLSDNWLNNSFKTYLTLNENTDLKQLDVKLRKYDIEGFNGKTWTFHLQPLFDIHFDNKMLYGTGEKGTILIFITVGLFILFIASFNYLNLYISHYRTRLKDVSIRTVAGATRWLLIRQFFSESFLLVFISYLISLALVWLMIPIFDAFFKQILDFQVLWSFRFFIASLVLVILMALIAGAYPAVYLTRLHLIDALKGGKAKLSKESQHFRKIIVVVQFTLSVVLITGAVTMLKQLRFIGNKDLGYEKKNIICLSLIRLYYAESYNLTNKMKSLKQELLSNPDIIAVSASTDIPCRVGWSNIPVWDGKEGDDNPFFYRMIVDYDFFDLYGIRLADGRNFSSDMATDDGNAYIINRAAAKRMGFQSPINARFGFDGKLGTVVGITQDFNFESLHKSITPLGIGVKDEYYWQVISIKVTNTDIPNTLTYIEGVWNRFVPDYPMDYTFVDNQIQKMYGKEMQVSRSMNYLSLLALFISCLGIFGLMSYSLKERQKEIGIRKAMGASFSRLTGFLARELFVIVCIADITGGFLGWYFSTNWLNSFAYRIDWGIDIIIISSFLTFFLAITPIVFNILKSVRTNPVESLRYE